MRSAFVARPGCLLLSADYCQIELRVVAHLSADDELLQVVACPQLGGAALVIVCRGRSDGVAHQR